MKNFPQEQTIQKIQFSKLAVAGRLDMDSRGLLVFTQDGKIAKQIIGENSNLEKEYIVTVSGEITEEKLKYLRHGLELDAQPLRKAVVEKLPEEGKLRMILQEGKYRQIKRMCEQVDLHVDSLLRIRIGKIGLDQLKSGRWRFLLPHESFL
jgi:23S rRNA pseudouridine2604 synthase